MVFDIRNRNLVFLHATHLRCKQRVWYGFWYSESKSRFVAHDIHRTADEGFDMVINIQDWVSYALRIFSTWRNSLENTRNCSSRLGRRRIPPRWPMPPWWWRSWVDACSFLKPWAVLSSCRRTFPKWVEHRGSRWGRWQSRSQRSRAEPHIPRLSLRNSRAKERTHVHIHKSWSRSQLHLGYFWQRSSRGRPKNPKSRFDHVSSLLCSFPKVAAIFPNRFSIDCRSWCCSLIGF